jgi:hypothetical protein
MKKTGPENGLAPPAPIGSGATSKGLAAMQLLLWFERKLAEAGAVSLR